MEAEKLVRILAALDEEAFEAIGVALGYYGEERLRGVFMAVGVMRSVSGDTVPPDQEPHRYAS